MFEFARYVARNPSEVTRGFRRLWKVRKAMRLYREVNQPLCAWCGRSSKVEIHHIEPVSVAPDKAHLWSNMIYLCRKPACHQVIGHDGDFKNRYVENVDEVCLTQSVVKVSVSVK